VQFSDNSVFTAIVTATSGVGGAITGSVEFKVNGQSYGSVPVNAAGYATLVAPITNNVGGPYGVTATFTSSNVNYGGSGGTASLSVTAEQANPVSDAGAYTGQIVAWTPTATSNTATLTLAATIKDASDGTPGNITKAKISFAFRDALGGLTPINGATDLAVGLVDPTSNTVGSSAVTLQFSLNSNEICNSFKVTVIVGGNYNMAHPLQNDTNISICRATPGSILSAPDVKFSNFGSGGYLGNAALTNKSEMHFDVKYNKSGTNPMGKVFLTVYSNKNAQGVVDGLNHTYFIVSNAISTLSVKTGTADFSAKANVTEIITDANGNVTSTAALDGGAIMQLSIVDGCVTGADMLGVTVNMSKTRGGIWYSSQWNGTSTVSKAIGGGDIKVSN
jgi:trimeric autotransporter adhesin